MYNIHRGVEQLEARRAHNPEVVGSSPTPATIRKPCNRNGYRASFLLLGVAKKPPYRQCTGNDFESVLRLHLGHQRPLSLVKGVAVHIQRGGGQCVAQNLRDGDDVGGLVQGLGGKGVPSGVEIDVFEAQTGENILKALLQGLGLIRVALRRAEYHVVGVELGPAVG